jgi:hypothetical protein
MAVADDTLHDDGSIEAFAEHLIDQIQNTGKGRIGHKQAG